MDSNGWEVVTAHEDEDKQDWWDDPNDWSSDRDKGEVVDDDDLTTGYFEWFDSCAYWFRWRRCPVCGRAIVAAWIDQDPPVYCNQDAYAMLPKPDQDDLPF